MGRSRTTRHHICQECVDVFLAEYHLPFRPPFALITDNGRQFIGETFKEFCKEWRVEHCTTSVENPATNDQIELANRIILEGLKKRLGDAKGRWVEELPSVLWSY